MALGVGVLGAEGGAEGVHLAEGHRHGLGFQLAGNRKLGAALEEILAEIHLTVLGFGHIVEIQRGHAEHFACALTVTARENGGVYIGEAVFLEEAVNGVCGGAAHTEYGIKSVGAGAQMGHGAQKLHAHFLFLQRVFRGAHAQDLDFIGVDLKGLLGAGGKHDLAGNAHAGVQAALGHLRIVVQLGGLKHHLHALEAAAVVQVHKANVFAVTHALGPAAQSYLGAVGGGVEVQLADLGSFHKFLHLLVRGAENAFSKP